jgi:hypothetical protein
LAARAWWPPKTTAASAGEAGDVKKAKKGESGGKAESSPKKAEGAPSAGGKTTSDQRGAEELNALRWLDRNGIRGFVDWTPIRRPDFPDKRVEVGGFQPFCRLNPPAKELDDLGERHFRFLIELTSLLPRVEFRTTKVDSLGGGVYRIAASVVNRGYLPTMSEMGRLSRRAYPLQIELQPPEGAELIQGPLRRRLDRLAGNGGASEQTWVVRLRQSQPAAAKLRVWAPAVGSDETTIRWKEKG